MAKSRVSLGAIAKNLLLIGDLSVQLARKHPVPLVGALWLLLLLLAVGAMDSLVAPELKDRSVQAERMRSGAALTLPDAMVASRRDSAEFAHNPSQLIQRKSRVPLWLFGAIAVTCAGSVLLLNAQLSPRQPSRKRGPHSKSTAPSPSRPARGRQVGPRPSATSASAASASAASASAASTKTSIPYPQPEGVPSPAPATPSPRPGRRPKTAQGFSPPPAPTQAATSPPPKLSTPPVVTPQVVTPQVVTPQETHALDWQEGSLVHEVDLRQRRSLASWLHEHAS